MKYLLLPLVFFALLTPLVHAEGEIEYETKFIEIAADTPLPTDLDALHKMAGADLLSAPRVTAQSGQKVQVEITHEVPPPDGGFITPGDKPLTGVTLVGVAHLQDGGIAYRVHLTISNLVKSKPSAAQVETSSHDLYATGTAKNGETVWLPLTSTQDNRRLLVLFTLRVLKS